eukprot:2210441-Amphidinium_carterae.1
MSTRHEHARERNSKTEHLITTIQVKYPDRKISPERFSNYNLTPQLTSCTDVFVKSSRLGPRQKEFARSFFGKGHRVLRGSRA